MFLSQIRNLPSGDKVSRTFIPIAERTQTAIDIRIDLENRITSHCGALSHNLSTYMKHVAPAAKLRYSCSTSKQNYLYNFTYKTIIGALPV